MDRRDWDTQKSTQKGHDMERWNKVCSIERPKRQKSFDFRICDHNYLVTLSVLHHPLDTV